jgi:hypothetical protein
LKPTIEKGEGIKMMMKATKGLKAEPFCPVKGQDMSVPAIVLGERGRGRVLAPIVVDPGVLDKDGFISGAVRIGETRSGKPKIVRGDEPPTAWVDRINTLTSYVRGAYGWVGRLPGSGVSVIARGLGAFGDAGRVGTWGDYLLIVPTQTWLRVKPSRGQAYFLWYPDLAGNGEVRVAEDSIDAFAEGMDVPAPPTDKEAWEAV